MRYVCLLALIVPLLSAQDRAAASIGLSDGLMSRRAEGLGPADLFALIGYTVSTSNADADAAAALAQTCKVDHSLRDAGVACRQWKFQTSVGSCRITAAALADEPEAWGIGATVYCGSPHGLAGYLMGRCPQLGPPPPSNAITPRFLGGELALISLTLWLTFYFQSKKSGLPNPWRSHLGWAQLETRGNRMPSKGNPMRSVCLFTLMLPALYAQDGAAIYKERCASCHDMPQARVPSLAAIKAMSAEAIYVALSNGSMKSRVEGLSTPGIFALIGYIAPTGGAPAALAPLTPTCAGAATFRPDAAAPQWNGWSPSLTNSRFQEAPGLSAADLPQLKLKWAFNLGNVTVARSQPAIGAGRVFVTSQTGAVYALDAASGCTRWGFQASPGLRGGVTLGESNGSPAVFFSDGGGTMFALNAQTGALLWKIRPVDHYATTATATPSYYKGVIYQPYASFEEALGPDPKFGCCTFRGSVAAIEAATGKKLWQTYTIAETSKATSKNSAGTQLYGPSGASVWSSPTIDEQLGVLYVATGDNYSDPATNTSDAILAMDLKTGELRWSQQLTSNDAYNNGCATPQRTNCPAQAGPDYDFGQPPILVGLGNRQRALVIGQKSGMVHAVDPDQKGKILWQTRVGQGSALGGSQWGSAADRKNVYVAISDPGIGGVPDPKSPQGFRLTLDPRKGGGLHALDLQTGKIVWNAAPSSACSAGRSDCSPAQSAAVTAIPGVVFSGALDGHLRAYSTSTGEILWDTDTAREFDTVNGKTARGGSLDAAGPAVAGGMVFVNSGYGQWGGMPGNVLLAFSVNGK